MSPLILCNKTVKKHAPTHNYTSNLIKLYSSLATPYLLAIHIIYTLNQLGLERATNSNSNSNSNTMVRKKRSTSNSIFSFGCGCGSSKSVSVSDSSDIKSPTVLTTTITSATNTLTPTITSASTSSPSPSPWDDDDDIDADKFDSSSSTPSFSGLLRQLNELENTVMSLPHNQCTKEKETHETNKLAMKMKGHIHKRSMSESGMRVLEESVVVVKESDDPLSDFRRSMLQMIVEKEIVDKEELCELLRQFLALNLPQNHHVILQAFAEIWEEIFAEHHTLPEFSVHHHPRNHRYPSPLRF